MVPWSGRSGVCVAAWTCAALLVAACGIQAPSPNASVARPAPPADARVVREQLADRYLAIAQAGNRRLEKDPGRLEDRDGRRLTTAQPPPPHPAPTHLPS